MQESLEARIVLTESLSMPAIVGLPTAGVSRAPVISDLRSRLLGGNFAPASPPLGGNPNSLVGVPDKPLCVLPLYIENGPPALGEGAPVGLGGGAPPPPVAADDTFLLHSKPDALKVIYLDFNGHTTAGTWWNYYYSNNQPFVTPAYSDDGDPSTFNAAEQLLIKQVWEIVSEDFIPFDVDVTTEEPPADRLVNTGGADNRWGVRVVIGPNTFYPASAGGVAFLDSFNWDQDAPAFVFNPSVVGVSEAASHEVGHSLGLDHDRTGAAEYYPGHGSGDTGWAPIMGVGYSKELVQWSKGEYPGATNFEDDLVKITTLNGFDYRTDDHGNAAAGATAVTVTAIPTTGRASIAGNGIIERTTDFDFFSFSTDAGVIDIDINPFHNSPNLDIRAVLYNSLGAVVATSNPINTLNATFDLTLAAGDYIISIEGIGKTAVAGHPGYSDYASLGYFSITGTVPAIAPQVTGISINGGSNQRSLLTSMQITFDRLVNVSTDSFVLTRLNNDDDEVSVAINSQDVGGVTIVTLSFVPGAFVTARGAFLPSLADGNYKLTVKGSAVIRRGALSIAMEQDKLFGNVAADNFFRLFGDANGNRTVASDDLSALSAAFGAGASTVFDYDGDGQVNFFDFSEFGKRYGTTLP